jgi:hypothetical protein
LADPDPPSNARGYLVVLRFGRRRVPRSLRNLGVRDVGSAAEIDAAIQRAPLPRRFIVAGATADLAAVLTRLLRNERLDIEVAHLDGRWGAARRARRGAVRRVPLVRDETGQVIVGAAYWLPPHGAPELHGEGVVDDTVLFDGNVRVVRIEPTSSLPGLRARVQAGHGRRARWVTGRAAQLGSTGAHVVRDGVATQREVRRSTFYRHTEGWLRVY